MAVLWGVYLQRGHVDSDTDMEAGDEWIVTRDGQPYMGGSDIINQALEIITDRARVGDRISIDVEW